MEIKEMLVEIEETLKGYVLRVGPLAGKLPDGRTIREFMAQEVSNHCELCGDDDDPFSKCLEIGVAYMYDHICDDSWLREFFFAC